MRVLMLSLDRKILEKDSAVQKRLSALAEALARNNTPPAGDGSAPLVKGELTIFVPAKKDERQEVSPHLTVLGIGGAKFFQFLKLWGRAVRELKERTYDLITVQDIYFLGFLAVKLAEKFSLPLEVQVHGFEKMRGVRERLARFVLQKATKIRVVSNRLKELLTKSYKLKANSLYVLPVYTQKGETGEKGEKEKRGEMGRKRKRVPYPFTFLTVGRLVPVKNIALQIRAFARLARKYHQVRLRIVGSGTERESLKCKVQNEKLEDKVEFAGYQKELNSFYEEADAFLLTSDSEGWGLAVLEAAAYKLPIIMTNVGLANEVLHHNKECIVIPVGDEDALVAAMRRVMTDASLRARLGAAARLSFLALPSREEQIQKQIMCWNALLR